MTGPSDDPRHVVILGQMGAGKTTVGRLVADRLGWPFLDGDVVLEATRGMTAAEIGATGGIEALHSDEAWTLRYLLAKDRRSVISPAASVVEDPESVAALGDPTLFVAWLRADPDVLATRAAGGIHRPWHGSDVAAYLRDRAPSRDPVFAGLADVVVDVDAMSPRDAASLIDTAVRLRR